MAWFRLDTGYFNHPKTILLRRTLGSEADTYPPRLWAWCAEHARDGRPPPELVEEVSGWKRKPGRLVETLKAIGFLDEDGSVHGWMERSGSFLSQLESKKSVTRDRVARFRLQQKSSNAPVTRYKNECNAPVTPQQNRTEHNVTEHKDFTPDEPAEPVKEKPKRGHGLTEDQFTLWTHIVTEAERVSPSNKAPETPDGSACIALREISKMGLNLAVVAKAVTWASKDPKHWRGKLVDPRKVANRAKDLVSQYESCVGPPAQPERTLFLGNVIPEEEINGDEPT